MEEPNVMSSSSSSSLLEPHLEPEEIISEEHPSSSSTSATSATGSTALELGSNDVLSTEMKQNRRLFTKELRLMLFGFGDEDEPYQETIDCLEDLTLQFINDITKQAINIGRPGRVQVEDVIFLVRKHPKMYGRVRELLTMNEELKKARKAFDEIKYVQPEKKPTNDG